MAQFYIVGGYVRDQILGIKSKDKDYAVEAPSYEAMKQAILDMGGTIFIEKPEFLTIRAKVNGEACDYVLCRKEGSYTDGRRPDKVEAGTLLDDLARRDFTMNAMAISQEGDLIDPFHGRLHMQEGILHCVGEAAERFSEDSLRMLRAIRFSITKNMALDSDIVGCLFRPSMCNKLANVSTERIREELLRCFQHNTWLTMKCLAEYYPLVGEAVFQYTPLWLMPTLKAV